MMTLHIFGMILNHGVKKEMQKEFRAQLSDMKNIIVQYESENRIYSLSDLNKMGYSLFILDLNNEIAIFNYNSSNKELGKDGL